MASTQTLPPDVAKLLPLLDAYQRGTEVGTLLSSVCFGILCGQLYTFATAAANKRESTLTYCFVSLIAVLEFAHTILLWVFVLDANHGSLRNPFYYIRDTYVFNLVLCLTGVIGAIVQSYYACRLYRVSGYIWFSVLPWASALARLGIAITGTCLAFIHVKRNPEFTVLDVRDQFGWIFTGTLAASVAADVLNTVLLCAILARHRDGTERSTLLVDRLIIWTVETGMVTSCMAVVLLCFAVSGHYELLPCVFHVYPNMFSLSLLLSYNAREGRRRALFAKSAISTLNIWGNDLDTQAGTPRSHPNTDSIVLPRRGTTFVQLDELRLDRALDPSAPKEESRKLHSMPL